MSDTSKCPVCGEPLHEDFYGVLYCQGFDCDAEMTSNVLNRIRELESYNEHLTGEKFSERCHAALHSRIRELEARIAAKDEALSRIDDCTGEGWTMELAREALKK